MFHYQCPHCDKRGISFFDKLICNPFYAAQCRICRKGATKSGEYTYVQLGLAIAFLAVVPNIMSADDRNAVAIVGACIVIAVGQFERLIKY